MLADLDRRRAPIYAEADVIVDSRRGASHEAMAREILAAVRAHEPRPPGSAADPGGRAMTETVTVPARRRAPTTSASAPGLLARAGAEIAPLLRRPRVAVVTEARVAALHLPALEAGPRATRGSRRAVLGAAARRGDQGLGRRSSAPSNG